MHPLRDASRYLFLGTLIYAPWAYGCTTGETIVVLNWLLTGVALLWVADLALRRRLPVLPRLLPILLGLILVIGWGMTLNARAVYDPVFSVYSPIRAPAPALPGSYDAALSSAMMIRATLLAIVLCFVTDLCRRAEWLLRIWQTIGAAGASIALLGLLQKGSGARMIFWDTWAGTDTPSFFATYFYHANAGAYLNLIVLPTLGLSLRAMRPGAKPTERALWVTAGLLVAVAVLANTSRVAQLLGLLLMLLFAAGPARKALRSTRATTANKLQIAAAVMIGIVAIVAVAQASRLNEPLKRWRQLSDNAPHDARWQVSKVALHASPDAGWFGLGPGAFRAIFPPYADAPGSGLSGTWRFLHEDYLQTILEWGYIGALLLALVFFGGIGVAVVAHWKNRATRLPRQRAFIPLILLALASVAIHGLVDFPMQIASIQLYVVTYLGICWSACRWQAG